LSKIYELFGYRLSNWNSEAESNLQRAWCPFMDAECDGGGNRYQSAIDLSRNPALQSRVPGKDIIQCGVCSLQTREGEQPWIVCPRRLFSLKKGVISTHQVHVREKLSSLANLNDGRTYAVWSEVKIKTEATSEEDEAKSFDYTFDYVLSGVTRKRISDISAMLSVPERTIIKIAENNGYTLALRDTETWIDDFPTDPLIIIEVMTSSTSGGNKKKRTQISMACEDAILHQEKHNAPGINYRQVWARMVSQLIVKSQVGIAWGGKTIWLVQDVLADYISKSTALVLSQYLSDHLDEVNILSFGYGDQIRDSDSSLIELKDSNLYAGPITKNKTGNINDGFVDIVKIGAPPPKEQIWKSLFNKPPIGMWSIR
jgi:hypothetical protein